MGSEGERRQDFWGADLTSKLLNLTGIVPRLARMAKTPTNCRVRCQSYMAATEVNPRLIVKGPNRGSLQIVKKSSVWSQALLIFIYRLCMKPPFPKPEMITVVSVL